MTDPRQLPAVHTLLSEPRLASAADASGHDLVTEAARAALETARNAARAGQALPDMADLVTAALALLADWTRPRPRRLINASGVILHTNLGRAPLSKAAARAMADIGAGYSDLELDLASGERGSRQAAVTEILRRLTGAEDALVVNNNAGATLLVVAALARGRAVVVSRGQLVEIGGSFRIPDILAAGGAELVEVGTTNRSYLADYRAGALASDAALLLKVHSSNFRIIGFSHEVALPEMVALGRELGIPVIDDLGSGSLIDTRRFGLAPEPLVQDSVAAGADLVTFSGDKLLGGPQSGLIVGRRAALAPLRRHPFARALRPGKDCLAALHATLRHYLQGEAETAVPVWRMIARRPEDLARRAADWQAHLGAQGLAAELVAGHSTIGGGSLPGETLPTTLVTLGGRAPDRLAAALRAAEPPVLARIAAERLLLDPRTVLDDEDAPLLTAVAAAWDATAARQPPPAAGPAAGTPAEVPSPPGPR